MTIVKQYQGVAKPVAGEEITLSEAAIQHLTQALQKRGSGIGMRLSIKTTGCSGYSYVVDFIDETPVDDFIFPIEGNLVLAVDPNCFSLVKGTHIDFQRQGINAVFVYRNPNQTGECGCGESFSTQ